MAPCTFAPGVRGLLSLVAHPRGCLSPGGSEQPLGAVDTGAEHTPREGVVGVVPVLVQSWGLPGLGGEVLPHPQPHWVCVMTFAEA